MDVPDLHLSPVSWFVTLRQLAVFTPASTVAWEQNSDSGLKGYVGPISWVPLTTGAHLITAGTQVGGRACQSMILGGGWYLSFSLASIMASADNCRLASSAGLQNLRWQKQEE